MKTPAFDELQRLLSEMQNELGLPKWPETERIAKAYKFHLELWDAIVAYRKEGERP